MAIDKNIPAWHLSASQYCIQQGVKEPYICEISPMQMGLMSKRQRAQYGKQRDAEWNASAECKQEWARKVVDACKAGVFDWRRPPPELHPEARSAAIAGHIAEEKAQREEAWQAYRETLRVTKPTDTAPGERLHDILYNGYVRVVKLFPKSLRVVLERDGENAKPYTTDARRFERLRYCDAQAEFAKVWDARSIAS